MASNGVPLFIVNCYLLRVLCWPPKPIYFSFRNKVYYRKKMGKRRANSDDDNGSSTSDSDLESVGVQWPFL